MYGDFKLSELVEEYRTSFDADFDLERVRDRLVIEHDWTETGAGHLLDLVRQYGSFVLCHAAALSQALNIEDGNAGL